MTPNKIAVTGGIGSGKSVFCEIVREFGFPVFSCDAINRELWTDEAYLSTLSEQFPDCLTGGSIDKAKLSEKVFSDDEARRRLNALAHPAIIHRLLAHMNACKGPSFAEVPLLYEGGYEALFDAVIALRRAKESRIAAVEARDGLKREETLARMSRQLDPARLSEKHCLILDNDGDRDALKEKARNALRSLHLLA